MRGKLSVLPGISGREGNNFCPFQTPCFLSHSAHRLFPCLRNENQLPRPIHNTLHKQCLILEHCAVPAPSTPRPNPTLFQIAVHGPLGEQCHLSARYRVPFGKVAAFSTPLAVPGEGRPGEGNRTRDEKLAFYVDRIAESGVGRWKGGNFDDLGWKLVKILMAYRWWAKWSPWSNALLEPSSAFSG